MNRRTKKEIKKAIKEKDREYICLFLTERSNEIRMSPDKYPPRNPSKRLEYDILIAGAKRALLEINENTHISHQERYKGLEGHFTDRLGMDWLTHHEVERQLDEALKPEEY